MNTQDPKMNWKERKHWIRVMWRHHIKVRKDELLTQTSFWDCLMCTLALVLNLESHRECDGSASPVAWIDTGEYLCDSGMNQTWDVLEYKNLSFSVYSDSKM